MATGMKSVKIAPFTLRKGGQEFLEGAERLAQALRRVSLEQVFAEANRKAARKKPSQAWGAMGEKPVDWFVFEKDDDTTEKWYPQGVSCAPGAGTGGGPAFAVSWYWKPEPQQTERGVRVSFLDAATARYRHALLVAARPDGSFGPIDIHAGGIAWHKGLLYVADTSRGLRVFDMDYVLDMRTGRDHVGDEDKIGWVNGEPHAYNYRYVIPQIGHWRVVEKGARFSFAAVDGSGKQDLLISGEYVSGDSPQGRVARWALDEDGHLVADDTGTATAVDAYRLPDKKIQGALSHGGRWYFSRSAGSRSNGTLIVVPKDGPHIRRRYPIGPEDLTCLPKEGTLWSVTEYPGRRALFAVRL